MGLASLALHWLVLGVRLDGDSPRYLEAASRLLAGLPLVDKQGDFLAYAWLVALVRHWGGEARALVVCQGLVSLAAGLALAAGAARALGPRAGLLAGAAYLLWPDLQRWNFYLLSDGPFNSLLAASLGLALLASRRAWWWLALAPVLGLLLLSRPEGAFFLLPLALYFALMRQPWPALALVLASLGAWLLRAPSPASQAEILLHWGRGTVILGYPALDRPLAQGLQAPSLGSWLVMALEHEPWGLARVAAQRGFWFLAHVRPFYSLGHNLLAGPASLVLLGLGVWGALTRRGARVEAALCWGVVLVQLGLAMLTWADWDGRFLTRVTPALLVLAVLALAGRPQGGGRLGHL